jgi:hypothetical protein
VRIGHGVLELRSRKGENEDEKMRREGGKVGKNKSRGWGFDEGGSRTRRRSADR